MKNLIYPIIAAAVILCSCKGNSFLNQRYTHFGHAAKATHQTIVASNEPQVYHQQAVAAQPAPVETIEAPLASVAYQQSMVKQHNRIRPLNLKHAKSLLAGTENTGKTTATVDKKQKSSVATTHRKGVIGDLVGLILSIILTAVVIAAIIIIVLIII